MPVFTPIGGGSGKIAFTSFRNGTSDIFLLDVDGGNVPQLTNDFFIESSPSWSPDGSKILFYSNQGSNSEIYVMSAKGRNKENLTNNSAEDKYPAWSPCQKTEDAEFGKG